ncbi:MAG: alpha/beta hydrolase [Thermoflexales bacterium]|nr:alpha/beta hydrolase [Thermoflexales bacterium]
MSQLFFVERGDPEAPAVVFLHGFPFNHAMWQAQVEVLSQRYRCIAPDLRGYGRSPQPPDCAAWTMDDFADDVAALMDALGIARATVCGLSMGGYVAFALWRRHRSCISRLILANTKAAGDSEQAKQNRRRHAELVRTQGMRAFADEMLPKLLAPNAHPAVAEAVRAMIESTPIETVLATLPALADRPDMSEALSAISVPTLVVVGEQDAISPLSEAQFMQARIPGARLAVIPNTGHLSPMEQPEAFNQAVLAFLSETDSGSAK